MSWFFDSSFILEIINKNNAFSEYENTAIITTTLHLAEVHNVLLRAHNEQTADYWAGHLDFSFLEISPEDAIAASKFRYKNKKENISYADCIGYILALKHSIPFLTCDSKFKKSENVEFAA